ncbi:MAG: chemotaxis protein CheW [Desulfovibrio sp.]|jgi:purine-binding chemotaxis protein CheW|nr:chemotaxis protein CheW [Desulfovibrio sp.]
MSEPTQAQTQTERSPNPHAAAKQPPDGSDSAKAGQLLQLVTFSIGEEEFGVDILKVQEIIRTMDITKVPRAPAFVEGVINLRGKVIPIVDLRRRFGMDPRVHDKHTRIIVIEIHTLVVGFVVDAVSEVLRIPASTVEPPPPVVAGLESDYINGVGKLADRLLILLDLDRLLSKDETESTSGHATAAAA